MMKIGAQVKKNVLKMAATFTNAFTILEPFCNFQNLHHFHSMAE